MYQESVQLIFYAYNCCFYNIYNWCGPISVFTPWHLITLGLAARQGGLEAIPFGWPQPAGRPGHEAIRLQAGWRLLNETNCARGSHLLGWKKSSDDSRCCYRSGRKGCPPAVGHRQPPQQWISVIIYDSGGGKCSLNNELKCAISALSLLRIRSSAIMRQYLCGVAGNVPDA